MRAPRSEARKSCSRWSSCCFNGAGNVDLIHEVDTAPQIEASFSGLKPRLRIQSGTREACERAMMKSFWRASAICRALHWSCLEAKRSVSRP